MSIVGSNMLGSSAGGSYTSNSSLKVPSGGVYYVLPGFPDQRRCTFSFWVKSFMEGLQFGTVAPTGGVTPYPRPEQYFLSIDGGEADPTYKSFSLAMLKQTPDPADTYGYNYLRFESGLTSGPWDFKNVVSPILSDGWMHVHIMFDTGNSAPELRQRVFINGKNILSNFTPESPIVYPERNAVIPALVPGNRICIGQRFDPGQYDNNFLIHDFKYMDGIRGFINRVGTVNESTGQWQPTIYTGLYGNYGSHLDFSDGTTAESLLADSSGNNETWSADSITPDGAPQTVPSRAYDSPMMWGKPYGHTAGLNTARSIGTPLQTYTIPAKVQDAGYTFTSGPWPRATPYIFNPVFNGDGFEVPDLGHFAGYGAYATHTITTGMKTYYEVYISMGPATTPSFGIFLGPRNPMPSPWPFNMLRTANNPFLLDREGRIPHGYLGLDKNNETHCYDPFTGNFWEYDEVSQTYQAVSLPTATTGDVIGVAADYDAGTISFYKNNELLISTTATNTPEAGEWFPGFTVPSNGTIQVNFGRYPFVYAPPSGYSELSAVRQPNPSILRSETEFVGVSGLGTGDLGINRTITGLDLNPSLILSHAIATQQANNIPIYEDCLLFTSPIIDSAIPTQYLSPGGLSRRCQPGTPNALKYSFLPSSGQGDNAGVVTFNQDGYTMGQNNDGGFNEYITKTYAQYVWKAPESDPVTFPSNPNSGEIGTTCYLNAQAGITYMTWSGNSEGYYLTIPHNLGAAPEAVIYGSVGSNVINYPVGTPLYVVHKDRLSGMAGREGELQQSALGIPSQDLPGTILTEDGYVYGMDETNIYGKVSDGSSGRKNLNELYQNYWAMCIRSVPGFSKVGTYVGSSGGTGQDPLSGNYVHCGFKPAWILITGWNTIEPISPDTNPQREYYSVEFIMSDMLSGNNPVADSLNTFTMGHDPMGDGSNVYSWYDELGAPIATSAAGFTVCSRALDFAGRRPLNYMGMNYHYIAFAQAPAKYTTPGLLKRPSDYL